MGAKGGSKAPRGAKQPRGQSRPPRVQSLGQVFEAAKHSGFAGMFYVPGLSLSVADAMPSFTRDQVAAKAMWLYNNCDAVRAVIDGISYDEVDCGLWPKWRSSSPAFNRLATDIFHEECGDPRFFHAAGVESVYSAQVLIRRTIRLCGELFVQFLHPGDVAGLPSLPLVHFVNSWQIGNLRNTQLDQSRWREGIMVMQRLNRPLKYRVLTNREGTQHMDVSADDMVHLHDEFWNGQLRGMSCLTPVVKKLFRMKDIENAAINGALLRERIAYAIHHTGDGAGDIPKLPGVTETEEVQNKDGSKITIQKIVAGDSDAVDVATMPDDWKMTVVESQRATQTPEFLKHMLYGVALATKYPPDYIFFLAGMVQGTAVRMLQKRVQRVKNAARNFSLADQFLKRWVPFWTWQRIKAGRFDSVPIPDDWWRHKIIFPPDDTVDVAREGRLYDERLHAGDMAPSDYHGLTGRDDEDVEDEILEARQRKADKVARILGYEKDSPEYKKLLREILLASGKGAAPAAAAPAPPPGDPDDDPKNPDNDDDEE